MNADDVNELRDHLVEAVDSLPQTETIVVTKNGAPVAYLVDYDLYRSLIDAVEEAAR